MVAATRDDADSMSPRFDSHGGGRHSGERRRGVEPMGAQIPDPSVPSYNALQQALEVLEEELAERGKAIPGRVGTRRGGPPEQERPHLPATRAGRRPARSTMT